MALLAEHSPDLMLLDGGRGQLSMALAVVKELNIENPPPIDDHRRPQQPLQLHQVQILVLLVRHHNYQRIPAGDNGIIMMVAHQQYVNLDPVKLKELLRTPLIVDGRRVFDRMAVEAAGLVYRGVGLG